MAHRESLIWSQRTKADLNGTTNPATSEIRKVTQGVDPGWDYNPGWHRTLGIHRRDAERPEAILTGRALATTPAPVREQLVRTRIGQSLAAAGFRWFIDRPRAKGRPPRRKGRDEHIEAVGSVSCRNRYARKSRPRPSYSTYRSTSLISSGRRTGRIGDGARSNGFRSHSTRTSRASWIPSSPPVRTTGGGSTATSRAGGR